MRRHRLRPARTRRPGFGPRHIEATVEQRPPHVVLLRCAGPLVAGRYAVTCNEQAFELGVLAN